MEAKPCSSSIALVVMSYPRDNPGCSYGHAAIRIIDEKNGEDDLYEFCRGEEMPRGSGFGLYQKSHFKDAIKTRFSEGATTITCYRFCSTLQQNETAKQRYFALRLSKASKTIIIDFDNGDTYDVDGQSEDASYHYLTNNCVTNAVDIFESATKLCLPINNRGQGLYLYEKAVIVLEGWPGHTFLPADLNQALASHAQEFQLKIETFKNSY